jgi:hypothetical protein
MEHDWEPGKYWRVVAADKSIWHEGWDEEVAREAMRPGDQLLRVWTRLQTEWRPVSL